MRNNHRKSKDIYLYLRIALAMSILLGLLLLGTGCQSSNPNADETEENVSPSEVQATEGESAEAILNQSPVNLRFFSETHQTEFDANSLQAEKAALFYSLGPIEIDGNGNFSIGYGPITVENSVFFPGNAGTIEARMEITDANWSGTYDSKTQTGSGKYYFSYTLSGQEADTDAEVIVYLDGTLSIKPSEIEAHKGRVEVSFSGNMDREITIGGTTTQVKDEDDSVTYIFAEE